MKKTKCFEGDECRQATGNKCSRAPKSCSEVQRTRDPQLLLGDLYGGKKYLFDKHSRIYYHFGMTVGGGVIGRVCDETSQVLVFGKALAL